MPPTAPTTASPGWPASRPSRGAPRWNLEDDAARVQAKLLKAFAEVTGIYAEPAYAQAHLWRWARTEQPLGASHLWDGRSGLGVCGDWCLGHRVEDAFVSGLELALAVHRE